MQAFFLAVLLCFAKIFRESCVEKYKEFNGVNISSTRARTNVLGSLRLKAGMKLAIAMNLVTYDVNYVCMSAKK